MDPKTSLSSAHLHLLESSMFMGMNESAQQFPKLYKTALSTNYSYRAIPLDNLIFSCTASNLLLQQL